MNATAIDAPSRLKIFLSFSAQDTGNAERLAAALADRGLVASSASQAVQPGEAWAARIGDAISQSDAVAFLLSGASVDSPGVAREIGYALSSRPPKRVIPVLLDESADIPPFLRHLQYVNLTPAADWNAGVDSLIAAVKVRPQTEREYERELQMRRRMLAAEHATLLAQHEEQLAKYHQRSARLARMLGIVAGITMLVATGGLMTKLVGSAQLLAYVAGAVTAGGLGVLYGFFRARK